MARDSSPRFVHEFALAPTPRQARVLRIRFDLARQFYNACLRRAKDRVQACRRDPRWREARTLRAQKTPASAKAAAALYRTVIHDVLLAEALGDNPAWTGRIGVVSLKHPAPGLMTRFRQAHFADHLDFKTCQDMATRAYAAVDRARMMPPTRRTDGTTTYPTAHFRRFDELRAIASQSIHWRGDAIQWDTPLHKAFRIPVRFDPEDRHGVQARALAQMAQTGAICEALRVLPRTIRGTQHWYCQVTIKGQPTWDADRYPPAPGTVGIDFGPSQIGVVFHDADGVHGLKLPLAAGLQHDYARIRRLQRALDRSRRATNPENYLPNGTVKRGRRLWVKSQRYLQTQARLTDLWRRYAAHRKNVLGQLANTLLTKGTTIQIEAVSYKAWQRQWGKSIGRGAPGLLERLLTQKAALVGGQLVRFSTHATRFSQLCHGCGTYTKKSLSQRIHHCACGVGPIDRDIYSAFLAYHYDLASTTLDTGAAQATFAALQCGAKGVQGISHTTSVLFAAPGIPARVPQSRSFAPQALSCTEAAARTPAAERCMDTPAFQGHTLASIAAATNLPGDPRTLETQHPGADAAALQAQTPEQDILSGRCALDGTQLLLFSGG